jgi:hypothetical protein
MEVEINPNVNDILVNDAESFKKSKKRLMSEQSTDESAPQRKLLKTDVRKVSVPLHR